MRRFDPKRIKLKCDILTSSKGMVNSKIRTLSNLLNSLYTRYPDLDMASVDNCSNMTQPQSNLNARPDYGMVKWYIPWLSLFRGTPANNINTKTSMLCGREVCLSHHDKSAEARDRRYERVGRKSPCVALRWVRMWVKTFWNRKGQSVRQSGADVHHLH
jgi:hypothetical protein